VTIAVTGCSYTKHLTILNRQQAIDDVDYLVKKVKGSHPNAFKYISEEKFDACAKQIKDGFNEKTRRKDLSLLIAELLALICDTHTGHYDFPDFASFYNSGGKIFPVKLRYKDDRMVINNLRGKIQTKHIKKGDTVVSINGKLVETLLEQYGKYIPATTPYQRIGILECRLHYFF
jgi:C-terminal processing protease CtpA/Prc